MISEHISNKESVYSRTAIRRGIDNTPTEEHRENMCILAKNVFEPLRSWVGGPIKINSFYRSPDLNKAIGGSAKSQHCQGQAMDIDDTFGRASNAEMYHFIKKHLDFDQIIWEFGDDNNPDWIHVSFVKEGINRNRCLKAYKQNNKTNYKII
jgi:zinc D-Ala-D-Ala carboxypeptidase